MTRFSMFILVISLTLLVVMFCQFVAECNRDTYVVFKTWPEGRIVRILNSQGEEIKLENIEEDLDETTYSVVWVSQNYK